MTLTPNKSCTIYYTTDGTNPTTSSPVYSSAITIKTTTNLKFMARDSAGNQSITYSKIYTIQKLANPRIGAACQTCHDPYAHDKEQDGLKVNHPNFNCWSCHSTTNPRQRSALTFYLSCSGCHTSAHNMVLYSQFPVDIPKYPGFKWTEPDPYIIYKGDAWAANVFSGDMIVYTNKRKDVNKTDILNWYKQKTVEYGWEANSTPSIYLYPDGSFKMPLRRVETTSSSRANIHLNGDDTNGWRLIITYGSK